MVEISLLSKFNLYANQRATKFIFTNHHSLQLNNTENYSKVIIIHINRFANSLQSNLQLEM